MNCPKCNSEKVKIKRENQGKIREKGKEVNQYRTIAFCETCGFTWNPNDKPKKSKTKRAFNWTLIFWILGWICIYPIPATLILQKKTFKPIVKYGLIVLIWVSYLLIGFLGSK